MRAFSSAASEGEGGGRLSANALRAPSVRLAAHSGLFDLKQFDLKLVC
jgi:hypothetical protein